MTPFAPPRAPVVALAAHPDGAAAREIAIEHGALTRQMAGLQRRLGEQMRGMAQRVAVLEDEVLRLRAQLVVARTCMLWGLNASEVTRLPPSRANGGLVPAGLAEASSVICQTGCVGHAHPWLETDGQCRRTGLACAQVAPAAQDGGA